MKTGDTPGCAQARITADAVAYYFPSLKDAFRRSKTLTFPHTVEARANCGTWVSVDTCVPTVCAVAAGDDYGSHYCG